MSVSKYLATQLAKTSGGTLPCRRNRAEGLNTLQVFSLHFAGHNLAFSFPHVWRGGICSGADYIGRRECMFERPDGPVVLGLHLEKRVRSNFEALIDLNALGLQGVVILMRENHKAGQDCDNLDPVRILTAAIAVINASSIGGIGLSASALFGLMRHALAYAIETRMRKRATAP